jgi:hypothetical protein
MNKHTPWPWFVGTGTSDQLGPVLAIVRKEESCGAAIAIIDTVTGDEVSHANARLIAAAPDLLNALQAIVKSLTDQDDEGMIEHAQQMIDARSAIAKATGEQA